MSTPPPLPPPPLKNPVLPPPVIRLAGYTRRSDAFHSRQMMLSPSKTGLYSFRAHILINITLLTLVRPDGRSTFRRAKRPNTLCSNRGGTFLSEMVSEWRGSYTLLESPNPSLH